MKQNNTALYSKTALVEYISAVLLACCFFFWTHAVFRIVPSAFITLPLGFFESERRDVSWLAYLAVLTLAVVVVYLVIRSMQRSDWLHSHGTVVVSTALCFLGSILITCYPNDVALLILGGALCGIGVVGLSPSFYSSFCRFSRLVLAIIFLLVALCTAFFAALLFLLPESSTVIAVILCPVMIGVALIILKRSSPIGQAHLPSQPSVDDSVAQSKFKKDILICSCALMFSALYSCIIGFTSDALSSTQFLSRFLTFTMYSGLATAVILVIVRFVLALESLVFICFLVQATAILALPFMANSPEGNIFATSLNAVSSFVCQILIVFAVLQYDALTGLSSKFSDSRALLATSLTGVVGIPSIFIGAAIYHNLGLNTSAIAIAAIIILYLVFLVFGILNQRSVKVEHVLTGSFESEIELAHYRSQIIAKEFPALSSREREVLAMLLRGHSAPSVAEELYISENTAKSHIKHIYKKMSIKSRQELLKKAEQIPFQQEVK